MKILKLSSYYKPEKTSSSHLTQDLEDRYIQEGFEIEIFTPTPTRGVSKEVRDEYKKVKLEKKHDGKIIIHRFALMREGKNSILRALRYIACNFIQYHKGTHAKDIDLVMAGSTPPTQGILCAMVAKKLSKKYGRKVPFIYNLQDIFPDSLVNAGMTKTGSLLWRVGRKIEDYTYRNADKIIVIGEDFKNNILSKGVAKEKIEVIYNWVDENEVIPIPRNENRLFERFNLDPDKFYITYCGNIGHSQNFKMLIDAAKQLEEFSDIQFVIIGEGAFKPNIEKLIAEKNLSNIHVFPFQPYKDIAHIFSLGDAGLVISKPNIGSSSIPSKTWSIMSAARPVLASFDINSETCNIIIKNLCGLCADAGNLDGFVDCVLKLYNDKQLCSQYGSNAREFILNNLTKEICTSKYIDLIGKF